MVVSIPQAPPGFTRLLMKSKFGAGRDFRALDPRTEEQLHFVGGKMDTRPRADVQSADSTVRDVDARSSAASNCPPSNPVIGQGVAQLSACCGDPGSHPPRSARRWPGFRRRALRMRPGSRPCGWRQWLVRTFQHRPRYGRSTGTHSVVRVRVRITGPRPIVDDAGLAELRILDGRNRCLGEDRHANPSLEAIRCSKYRPSDIVYRTMLDGTLSTKGCPGRTGDRGARPAPGAGVSVWPLDRTSLHISWSPPLG